MFKEVRLKFLEFFKKKDHLITESASLLPQNDKSILFINSGMAPMKRYFLNEAKPFCKRIANAQRCLRVGGKHNDLSEIGYTKRHHTFFEMLGNFSFGDYFKKEAIDFAWEFLTEEIKLDKKKLYITVHPKDEEAVSYWLNHVNRDKITKLEANIWTMGEVGPWGYCSEIFYDLEEGSGNLEEGDRYLEIWNLVFMQYCNDGAKNFPLDFSCIDTGIGLERIVSILEGKTDNYDINFFQKPLTFLKIEKHNVHSKIFLDHLRSSSALIMEGILPGPSQEGYVLRRLIRRMLRSFFTFDSLDLAITIKNVLKYWSDLYDFDAIKILSVLEKEKNLFKNTINEGLKRFEEIFKNKQTLTAEEIFLLHDTYGLTVDITYDLVRERGGKGDFAGFEKKMEECKQKNLKEKKQMNYPETKFLEQMECESVLIGVEEEYLIFDQTVFYGEGGGQVGDTGYVLGSNFKARIIDTKKYNKIYCHKYELIEGDIKIGEKIWQKIDKERRRKIEAHHSCSHLLQYVLEKLYGEDIQQMGSYVSDQKLREDFAFPSDKVDVKKVEEEINKIIREEIETKFVYTTLNKAREMGAKAFFEYEDKVRVVKVGESLELCGGTHVQNTKDIIKCKILKVSPVKSGVKRFEAIAGQAYILYLEEKQKLLEEGCRILNCQNENYINTLKKLGKTKLEAKVEFIEEKNGVKLGLIIGNEEENIEDLMIKNKLDVICLYVEKENKCNVKIKSKVLDARTLIRAIAGTLEAKGGGGNNEFAQTGGKKQESLEKLINSLKNACFNCK